MIPSHNGSGGLVLTLSFASSVLRKVSWFGAGPGAASRCEILARVQHPAEAGTGLPGWLVAADPNGARSHRAAA